MKKKKEKKKQCTNISKCSVWIFWFDSFVYAKIVFDHDNVFFQNYIKSGLHLTLLAFYFDL